MTSNNESDQAPFLPSSSQSIDMIEGNITSANNRTNSNELSTLDEPVVETIKREFFLFFNGKITNINRSMSFLQVISVPFVENLVTLYFLDSHRHFFNNGIFGVR